MKASGLIDGLANMDEAEKMEEEKATIYRLKFVNRTPRDKAAGRPVGRRVRPHNLRRKT